MERLTTHANGQSSRSSWIPFSPAVCHLTSAPTSPTLTSAPTSPTHVLHPENLQNLVAQQSEYYQNLQKSLTTSGTAVSQPTPRSPLPVLPMIDCLLNS